MFLRSLIIAVSIAALSATSAHAGWFDREKPRTEEASAHSQHEHQGAATAQSVKSPSTLAYLKAMRRMHRDMRKPLSGNVDVDFVRQMIPHHQGALDMARIQLEYGHDEELKKFNAWVIAAQTKEIGFMQNWLRRKDDGKVCKKAPDYFGEAMMNMHHHMAIKYTGDADVDYVRGMIAHHQGAIDMAAVLLNEGLDPDLNNLANDIYSSQNYEIVWMKDWLAARGHSYR